MDGPCRPEGQNSRRYFDTATASCRLLDVVVGRGAPTSGRSEKESFPNRRGWHRSCCSGVELWTRTRVLKQTSPSTPQPGPAPPRPAVTVLECSPSSLPLRIRPRAGGQHVFEGSEYYCTDRALHPRSAKFFTWNSVGRIASFDAFPSSP